MSANSSYYVYAYFDPRNYEMFYVGKGQGSRKHAHSPDNAGTAKECRIAAIKAAGLEPNIKVIAIHLTEDQAFLVEKALMWRPRDTLTNLNQGNYAENFRPPDTLHQHLPGFDTHRGIFFVNVGDHFDHDNRQWEDAYKYNFVAAGYGRENSEQLDRLKVGDVIAAYLVTKDYTERGFTGQNGYVGIGRVVAQAVPARDFRFNGRPLTQRMLKGSALLHDPNDADECEYLVGVKWIKKLPRQQARFIRGAGLWAGRRIVVDLSNQLKTLEYLEKEFKVDFKKLLAAD